MSDEAIETYKWVLDIFLETTWNKMPYSVVTYGDKVRKAIKKKLPGAVHQAVVGICIKMLRAMYTTRNLK